MAASVLVVDDETLLRRLVERVLRDAGYTVLQARHGHEAMSILHEHPVDVLVTDFMMPRMNGAELVATMRRELDDRAPPAILLSGTIDLVLPSQQRLFTAVLAKPFTPRQLVDSIALCLRMSQPGPRRKRSGTRMRAVTAEGDRDKAENE